MNEDKMIQTIEENIQRVVSDFQRKKIDDIIEVLCTLGSDEELIHLNFCIESLSNEHIKHIKHDNYTIFDTPAMIDYENFDMGLISFEMEGSIYNPINDQHIKCKSGVSLKNIILSVLSTIDKSHLYIEKVEIYLADNIPKDSIDWGEFDKGVNPCSEIAISTSKSKGPIIGHAIRNSTNGIVDVQLQAAQAGTHGKSTMRVNTHIPKGFPVYMKDIEGIRK